MNKITLYYSVLAFVIAIQFIGSVVSKSIAVQQTAASTQQQRQLTQLTAQEAQLTNQLAQQLSINTVVAPDQASSYIAVAKPRVLTPTQLVAVR
jgi:uncharacterized protein YueI